MSFAAAAFGLLPLINLLTTDRHLGVTLPAGDWGLAGFDLTCFALALGFATAARMAGRPSSPAASRTASAPAIVR